MYIHLRAKHDYSVPTIIKVVLDLGMKFHISTWTSFIYLGVTYWLLIMHETVVPGEGVGLVISRSLVQFPAGGLWSVLGQDSSSHTASVYPAVEWVPSMNKAVLRACALMLPAALEYPRGIKMISVCARGGRSCEHLGGYKTINRIPLPLYGCVHTWKLFSKGRFYTEKCADKIFSYHIAANYLNRLTN